MARRTFMAAYCPSRELSFDEGSCPWKGRLRWRVYNPQKPNKFHIKLFECCEAKTGWICGFDIYTGRTEATQFAYLVTEAEDLRETTRIVVGVLAQCGLLQKGYHVYMDNYYNSPELMDELELLGTYGCGTVRKNRDQVPKCLTENRCRQGQGIFRRRHHLVALKWHDKRDVTMLSTIHTAECTVVKNKRGDLVVKPKLIVDYIHYMGGVDLTDQLQQYYSIFRKTNKYWRKLFFYLLNMLLTNAFVLNKQFGADSKLTQYDFRMAIVQALLGEAEDVVFPSHRGRKSKVAPPRRLTERHFPALIPHAAGKKKRPLRDCVACNGPKKDRVGFSRGQSSYECRECQVTLCMPDCFREYHTKQDYPQALRDLGLFHPPQ